MTDHRLTTPHLAVTMDDGRLLTVQAANPDYLTWDRTAAKHNWPAMRQAPFMWLTFIAWAALRRTGQIEDMSWEAFSETHALQVASADADEAEPANGATTRSVLADLGLIDGSEAPEVATVGPTLQAPEPG